MKKLDIELLKAKRKIKVGEMNKYVIQLLNLQIKLCDIYLWSDRLSHIELHKHDFESPTSYFHHLELIPEIILNPDYIGIHPAKNSLEYIKKIDELIIVAVRLKSSGNLAVRTMYILSEKQLNDYIINKTVVKYLK